MGHQGHPPFRHLQRFTGVKRLIAPSLDSRASRGFLIGCKDLWQWPECRTITAVVNALAKAGLGLGENGSVIPRPKGKPR